ncbi:3'(2'),5'-bisphosphate nucleotidase CysQ [Alteribacillus sp. YIM 98480]|uniref:3'(2'),5'-bisphosphate nucleotidase CysQ n=1 Tax=Alteribacillus sp. YIM 98480 TaxID=2606599 RepID=UPI00131C1015|nr:3'(2'),5'-bisphosphate nucleotidase CysQ [Alteribacillus sp. YIM 98480]
MQTAVDAAIEAGKEIMNIYQTDFNVAYKEDESPLTIADERAHYIIKTKLEQKYPHIPILSEEGNHLSYDKRASWEKFWLVDPLDGTKEFIKKNGEFTVNIALIEGETPVFGVIYAPAMDMLYAGDKDKGAVKIEKASHNKNINTLFEHGTVLPVSTQNDQKVSVVASRSHMSEETKQFIQKLEKEYDEVETISAGSSLKLCLVAEGKADFYPRYAPTMEWDTGAGHAIVEAAGGIVTNVEEKKPLVYNKKELKNPWFLAQNKK